MIRTCIGSGQVFNAYLKQIAPLTRDRRRAALVPLMTKEEFHLNAREEAGAAPTAPPFFLRRKPVRERPE